MGPCSSSSKKRKNTEDNEAIFYSTELFEYKKVLGKGGFGKVWTVKHKQTEIIYAMKEMSKATIIDKRSI